MAPNRLSELRRQRDLIRAHLHWLDAEIADASPPSPDGAPAETTAPKPAPPPCSDAPSGEAVAEPIDAEPLTTVDTAEVHNEVQRGCLIYAAIAAAFGLGLIAFIYWRY